MLSNTCFASVCKNIIYYLGHHDDTNTNTGYEIIRRDRLTKGGGGVCFYVKNSINFTVRSDLHMDALENLCLEIHKPKARPFVIVTWYRPPDWHLAFFHLLNP